MNQNETFINHGNYDVGNIIKIIEDNKLDWDEFTDRQKKYNSEHIYTKTIPIIFDKSFNFNSFKIIQTNHYHLFNEEISKLENSIKYSTNENGKIIRAILVKRSQKKSIKPHVDTVGLTLVVCRRIHIPIQTNNDCFFTVDNDKRNLKSGEIWEINNDKKLHSVDNFGDTDRIHLIIDWVEQSILEKYDI
jgi:hypothetical protein